MNRKYKFHPGNYELGENEKFYSDMEAKGWRLVKRGARLSRFKRVEPSRARYRVEIYTPPFLEQSVLPEEQIAVFEDCGWEYVADQGDLHIFRAPEGSNAPEFYDDPVQQAATLKKVRRSTWLSLALALVILAVAFVLLGPGNERTWAREYKHFVQCPTAFTFYFFWLVWCVYQTVWSAWTLNRTYRRLKKGLPLDHEPKGKRVLHKLFNQGMLCLTSLSILVTVGQVFFIRSEDFPSEPDGPYITLSDIGWEGEPGKLYNRDPGVTRAASFLTDNWETLEVLNIPGKDNKQVWIRQDVYRLRFSSLVEPLAWALMEDSVFVRDADAFHPLEVPGLDAAWATEGLELVAMKGNLVAYVQFLGKNYEDFDPLPICQALAERWAGRP